jgi:Leucine-rich repeat (LRR) protein
LRNLFCYRTNFIMNDPYEISTLSSEQTYNMTNDELKKYTCLQSLFLRYNSSITDECISKLTSLTRLDLSYSSTITINGLSSLTNLTSLDLKSNREESFTIEALNSLPSLKHLYTDSKRLILRDSNLRNGKYEIHMAI